MTLIFSGNNFKYELEAVCKLFFPVESFNFVFSDDSAQSNFKPDGDYCFICRIKGLKSTMLSVFTSVNGRGVSEYERIVNDSESYEDDCEFALGRLLYKSLSKNTGIVPEWGVLTGVRPVKLINKLRGEGLSFDEISEHLKSKYLVTDQKIRIGYETAVNQDSVINEMPSNSYSLYVSIPFCPTRCSYCSFISQTVSSFKKLMPEYVDKLCEEIRYTADLLRSKGIILDSVYFGGGTPTSLEVSDLDRIMKVVSESFDMSRIREYTVEAGRPDTITKEKLDVIKKNGGTRVSINPQTIHQSVLDAIGRRHTVEQFYSSFEIAKEADFREINVDLIAGLPTDTLDGFKESVESVIGLQPENITVHALSIKRASDLMKSYDFTKEVVAEDMIRYATSRLLESGYSPYYLYRQKNQVGNQENIGWTKPGGAGIYNINIMEEVQTIIAVGAGATTKIVGKEMERFYNPKYPLDYIKSFETVLNRKASAAALISDNEEE